MAKQIRAARLDSEDTRSKLKELQIVGYRVDGSRTGEKIGTITGMDNETGLVWKCEISRFNHRPPFYPHWHAEFFCPSKGKYATRFGGYVWSAEHAMAVLDLFTKRYGPLGQH